MIERRLNLRLTWWEILRCDRESIRKKITRNPSVGNYRFVGMHHQIHGQVGIFDRLGQQVATIDLGPLYRMVAAQCGADPPMYARPAS